MTTVAEALSAARAAGLDRLDAQQLLSHACGRPRAWLLAHPDDSLDPAVASSYADLVRRRAAGEPFAYLVGEREFHGLTLRVTPAVLVPRPDTETLVDWALERLADLPGSPRVVDLGTGSGAIALAVKHRCPRARVVALDRSADALDVARDNAFRLGLDVAFVQGDWWKGAPAGPFDLALSNPPYIAADDPHLDALRHEPRSALTPEGDGLSALRAIAAGAPGQLAPDAWLLMEHGHDQGTAVRALLDRHGFVDVTTRRDLAGRERCTGGRRPASP